MDKKRGILLALICAVSIGVFGLVLGMAFVRTGSRAIGETSGSNADIVARVNPGVVTVVATREFAAGDDTSSGEGVQEAHVQRGTGTGFVVDPGGLIVTNQHVIANADRVRVKLHDGRTWGASVMGVDNSTDLALLKVDAGGLAPLRLGDSDALRVGDSVIAIGNPLEYERSVTAGIVSALGRKVYDVDPSENFIQTDASINRGNSGGPLLNKQGEVIGVNTVIRSDGRGISFAVPSNVVKRVVAQIRANGYVIRGYLGLTPVSLTPELREGLKLGDLQGVVVSDVSNKLPAEKAGIRPYDVITHFNGHPVTQADEFYSCVANAAPQKQVELSIVRGGQTMKLYPTLEERPKDSSSIPSKVRQASDRKRQSGGQNSDPSIGFSVRENTSEALRELHLGNINDEIRGGALVSDVDPLGPAADTHLSPGCVILEANRQPISSLEDFRNVTSRLSEGNILIIRFNNLQQRSIHFAAIKVGEN